MPTEYDAIYNLRDYGGYATTRGTRVRSDRLYRSGQHGDASDADLGRIAALDLRLVADLRGGSERLALPCRRPESFSAMLVSTDEETVDPARQGMLAGSQKGHGLSTPEDGRAVMRKIYGDMPYSPVVVGLLSRFFSAMTTLEGRSLVNCMAGKDRTGFAVYLLHHLLEVHPDDAVADYLKSNSAPGREAWLERCRQQFAGAGLHCDDEMLEALLSVGPDLLGEALAKIGDRHGDLDTYLREVIAISDADRNAIREKLTETA